MTNKPLRSLPTATKNKLLLYSGTTLLLQPLLKLASRPWPHIANQLKDRHLTKEKLTQIKDRRDKCKYGIVVFCSSAGEFEQGLTIIRQLQLRNDLYIHVFFQSRSGTTYAQARGETVNYSLAPADTLWNWRKLFEALRPNLTLVVRYELWPAFLATASQYGKLALVNASRGPADKPMSSFKKKLLGFFDQIFVVGEQDQAAFKEVLPDVVVSGDTKFDRAIERAFEQQPVVQELSEKFNACFGPQFRFIVGSAWKPDAMVAISAYVRLCTKLKEPWQLIIAPHDISPDMIQWLKDQIERAGLTWQLFSKMRAPERANVKPMPVVIVDTMGKLAEIYGCGQLCLVGGALHHKVHNVLEPAVHGLRLAFGPRYTSQAEAVLFKEANLAKVIENSEQLETWWENHAQKINGPHAETLAKIRELSGATNKILTNLEKVLT